MSRLRLVWAAILIVALPVSGAGQSSTTSRETTVPLPSIGLPLPQIGLPLPPMGLRPIPEPRERRNNSPRSRVSDRRNRDSDSRTVLGPAPTVVYVFPTYGWYPYAPPSPMPSTGFPGTPSRDEAYRRTTGTLRLEIESAGDPQVYVDGYYVGTVDDLDGDLDLEAGLHQIDLREEGYQPLAVNVRIVADRSITLRETLRRDDQRSERQAPPPTDEIAQPPAHRVTPPGSSMFYVIPGCYLGNVAPTEATLPAGCDLSQLVTYRP